MEKRKSLIVQTLICVGLLCVIWGGYWLIKHYILDRTLEVRSDDFSCMYQVDSVATEGDDFVIRGFAFKLKEVSEKGTFEIVLQDIETGETYFPRMKYEDRKDVNEYFLCEYDYTKSGFVATIKEDKLNLEEGNYEVLLKVAGRKLTYQTELYISKGQLMYTNPLEYKPLDVAGTDLEKIVEQGVLRVYRPDYGMYVYQYEGELYWIAEEEYEYVSGDVLEYLTYTTQTENLPKYRLENNWLYDNIGFVFCEREITEMNAGRYRVSKKQLPTEYSVERIVTGNNIDGWIWRQEFRPYYQFD